VRKRRYVARGVPGGYRIRDNRNRRWWGDHYELCPDELLAELNGPLGLRDGLPTTIGRRRRIRNAWSERTVHH